MMGCNLCEDTKVAFLIDKNNIMHELACPKCQGRILPNGDVVVNNPETSIMDRKIGSLIDPHQPHDPMRKDVGWAYMGLAATNWWNDYRLHQFWLARALDVWAAIPVEFRGKNYPPDTLVEKVERMVKEIKRLQSTISKHTIIYDGFIGCLTDAHYISWNK
jgi:hypothetical protein